MNQVLRMLFPTNYNQSSNRLPNGNLLAFPDSMSILINMILLERRVLLSPTLEKSSSA